MYEVGKKNKKNTKLLFSFKKRGFNMDIKNILFAAGVLIASASRSSESRSSEAARRLTTAKPEIKQFGAGPSTTFGFSNFADGNQVVYNCLGKTVQFDCATYNNRPQLQVYEGSDRVFFDTDCNVQFQKSQISNCTELSKTGSPVVSISSSVQPVSSGYDITDGSIPLWFGGNFTASKSRDAEKNELTLIDLDSSSSGSVECATEENEVPIFDDDFLNTNAGGSENTLSIDVSDGKVTVSYAPTQFDGTNGKVDYLNVEPSEGNVSIAFLPKDCEFNLNGIQYQLRNLTALSDVLSSNAPSHAPTLLPSQGPTPLPSQGSTPVPSQEPTQGTYAPTQGTYAPTQGTYAPTQGTYAPTQGTYAPTQGTDDVAQGTDDVTNEHNETNSNITLTPTPFPTTAPVDTDKDSSIIVVIYLAAFSVGLGAMVLFCRSYTKDSKSAKIQPVEFDHDKDLEEQISSPKMNKPAETSSCCPSLFSRRPVDDRYVAKERDVISVEDV